MRVLLLNQTFYPDPPATSLYLTPLAEQLVRQGHDVTVLTSQRAYDDPTRLFPIRETWRGVKIVRVWNTGFGYKTKWGRGLDFLTFLVTALLRSLFLRRADLVLTQTSPPLLSVLGTVLAFLWRARFVYWVMDLNPDEAIAVGWLRSDGLPARFLEMASRWTLRQADQVVVQDRFVRDRLKAKGVADEKIEVVPLWMHDEAAFDVEKREQFRRVHGLENKYVVMYAGNHTPCHPLDTLIDAAQLLREESRVIFCFIGFGLEWGRLRDRAQAEQLVNAIFLEHQPISSGLLSAADTQVVVMGDPFVGIVHACKIYNILAAKRPFVYIGPEPSHVSDIVQEAGLLGLATLFRHGESRALAEELRQRAEGKALPPWPALEKFQKWSETSVIEKMVSILESIKS